MKKQILVSAIALMSICLAACGTESSAPKESSAVNSAAETTTVTESAVTTTEKTEKTTVSETVSKTAASATVTEQQTTAAPQEPAEDLSAIAGEWIRSDTVYANIYLSIDASGKYTVENVKGERFSGTVHSENGAYSLYKTDGSLWNSFTDQKTGGSKQLVSKKNTDTVKIRYDDVNEDDFNLEDVTFVSCDVKGSLESFAGMWHEEIGEDADCPTLRVSDDGSFIYTAKDGAATNGRAYVTAEINPDDSVVYWFNLYLKDGTFWLGFCESSVPNDIYRISSGQDGARVFSHVWDGEYEFDGQLVVPSGQTVTVRSKPADSASVVKEVTDSMNGLSFFTCDTKGWYGVMLDKENPDETFGYVRTEYIRKSGN